MQDAVEVPGEFWLVTVTAGQQLPTNPSVSFLRRDRWEGDVATGGRHHDD